MLIDDDEFCFFIVIPMCSKCLGQSKYNAFEAEAKSFCQAFAKQFNPY